MFSSLKTYKKKYQKGGMKSTSLTSVPNSGGSKELDALPSIAYGVAAYKKDPAYNDAIARIGSIYGSDLSSEIQFLNKRLEGRGNIDVNTALSNIAKQSISSSGGHPTMRKFYSIIQENPQYVDSYQYGFNTPSQDVAKFKKGGKFKKVNPQDISSSNGDMSSYFRNPNQSVEDEKKKLLAQKVQQEAIRKTIGKPTGKLTPEQAALKTKQLANSQGLQVNNGRIETLLNSNSQGYNLFHNAGDVVGDVAETAMAVDGLEGFKTLVKQGIKSIPKVEKTFHELSALDDMKFDLYLPKEKYYRPTEQDRLIKKSAEDYFELTQDPRYIERASKLDKEFGTDFTKKLRLLKQQSEENGKKIVNSQEDYFPFNITKREKIPYELEGESLDAQGISQKSYKGFQKMVSKKEKGFLKEDFHPEDRAIGINKNVIEPTSIKNTINHELKHHWTNALQDDFSNILQNKAPMEKYGNFLKSGVIPEEANTFLPRKNYDYYSDPTEIDAYINTNLRQNLVDDGTLKDHFDILTKDKLSNFIQKNPDNEIVRRYFKPSKEMVWDKNKLINIFNKGLPAVGISAGAASLQQKQEGGVFKTGGITKEKAREMLHNPPRGKKLTEKQRKYFGWIASGRKEEGGMYSTEGYKDDSPDKNNPYNIIPSSDITMQGVSQPIFGIDETGFQQLMMPGNDYKFRGEQVLEIPVGMHQMPDGSIMRDDEMKKGGIHINPENRGKFTETKKRTGKTTEELTHSKNPLTRKRAIFAQNAAKWHKQLGGFQTVDPSLLDTNLTNVKIPSLLGRKPIELDNINKRPGEKPDLSFVPLFANSIGQALATRVENNRENNYIQSNLTNPFNVIPNTNNTNPYVNKGMPIYQEGGMFEGDDEYEDMQDEDFLFDDEPEQAPQEQVQVQEEIVPEEQPDFIVPIDESSINIDEEGNVGDDNVPYSSNNINANFNNVFTPPPINRMEPKGNSNAREQEATNYLIQKGIPEHAAAGIVGNLVQESQLNPNAKGDWNKKKKQYDAYGLAQWHPDRRGNMKDKSFYGQLDYLVEEARQRGDLDKIVSAKNPSEAAYLFAKHFERPKNIEQIRMQNAERIFKNRK